VAKILAALETGEAAHEELKELSGLTVRSF
jgi:hypothetical protein